MSTSDEKTRTFEAQRRLLEGLAYRMLGTLDDARDIVQETYLRWHAVEPGSIDDARAWLVTTCSRLALNVCGSARRARESYPGTWLPEPLIEDSADALGERDETVSIALMLALQRLSPHQRATFLLHDVFGHDFAEVAVILARPEPACRKLASRARDALRGTEIRSTATAEEHRRLLAVFFAAARSGDFAGLVTLLADDVALHTDGGGKASAAPHVLRGAQKVGRFFERVWGRTDYFARGVELTQRWFNGTPGIVVREHGRIATAFCLDVEAERIQRIYAHRNPDKLALFAN